MVVVTAAVSLVVLLVLGALAWTFLFSGDKTTTPEPTRRMDTVAPVSSTPSTPTSEPSSPPSEATTSTAPATADSTGGVDTPSPVATTESPETPTTAATEDVTVDVQEAARTRLEELHAASLPYLSIDGRWVAVLSTKKSGTTDASQTAKNGSHTFYEDDILALHEELNRQFGSDALVLLVKTSDFGRQPKSGDVFWRTVADRGFTTKDDVTAWCSAYFVGTAKEIENSCLPREVVPPTQP